MSNNLIVERVDSIDNLSQYFVFTWKDILDSNNSELAFCDPDWLRIWWKFYGKGFEELVLAVKSENNLVGVFPFVIRRKLFYKQVSLMGYPQATHMEIAVRPEYLDRALSAVFSYLNNLDGGILINLSGLKEGFTATIAIEQKIKCAGHPLLVSKTLCPIIHIDSHGYEELYQQRFSSHQKNRDRRNKKRLSLLGEISFEELKEADMRIAFALHESRWEKKLDTSEFTGIDSKNFYTYLLTQKSPRWQPLTLGLYLNKELLAFEYGYLCGGQALLYRSAHLNLFNIFALGKMTHKELIHRCFDRGLHTVNLGIGYEKHKFEWTAHYDIIKSLSFSKNDIHSRFIFIFYFLKGSLRNKLKENRKVVLFKRNTLGELKYLFSLEHLDNFCRRTLARIKKQGVWEYFMQSLKVKCSVKYQFNLLERTLPFPDDGRNHNTYQASLADVQELGLLMNCDPELVIRRFYKLDQCFVIKMNHSIICSVWVNNEKGNSLIYDYHQDRRLIQEEFVSYLFLHILSILQNQECIEVTLLLDKRNRIANKAAVKIGCTLL